jgi:hypothetical protein
MQQHDAANQQPQQQEQTQAEVVQAGQQPEQPDGQQTTQQPQPQQQPLPTPSALGAYTQREEHLQRQEAVGEILFAYVVNDNTPINMKRCVCGARTACDSTARLHPYGAPRRVAGAMRGMCVARHRAAPLTQAAVCPPPVLLQVDGSEGHLQQAAAQHAKGVHMQVRRPTLP